MPDNYKVLETPYTTVAAQELLRLGHVTKSGFVRKEGTLERMFKCLKWRQRFLILSQGCIYVYADDYSQRPHQSYSAKLFRRCERFEAPHVHYSFRVLPRYENGKTLAFACTDENLRKEWMGAIKSEMMLATNTMPGPLEHVDPEDYVYLEKEVRVGQKNAPRPATPDNSDSELDDDYTTIDETTIEPEFPTAKKNMAQRGGFPKVIPDPKVQQPMQPKLQKPKIRTPPTSNRDDTLERKEPKSPKSPQMNSWSRDSFQYSSTDRTVVESHLVARPEGTFLVRQSRQNNQEVLSVNINGGLKEFKIYQKDGQVTINHTDFFASVEVLVKHYMHHDLPNKDVRLLVAHSLIDPSYVNKKAS